MSNHQMLKFAVEIFLRGDLTPVRCQVPATGALVAIMATIKLGLKPSEEDLIQSITVEEAP